MKLETFFENFELLTDAPNAVSTLQKIILQLAVMGKLVPNNTNDSQVPVKLEEFLDKKNRNKNIAQLKNDEHPFYVHRNWQWQRLNNLGKTQTGTTPATNNPDFYGNDYSFIKPADISFSDIKYNVEGLSEKGVDNGRLVPKNSVLMVSIGGSIGKVGLVDRDCSCNQQINYITLKEQILPKLIYYFLKSPYFQQQVLLLAPTTTMPILSKGKWDTIPIPVPPFAEQKRIVEKCDRLFSICDEIEKRQQQRQESIVRMNESAIAQLLSSQNPDEFRQHWQRICNNFDLLYTVPETIPKLRQAILQLAVQGKLVRQDLNDEPTEVLLKKVEVEKQELIKAKKLKKQWSFSQISDDEAPYKIPDIWKWIRILEGVQSVTVGHVGSMQNEYVDEGIPFLRSQNVRENRFESLGLKFISPKFHNKLLKSKLQPNDVVVVRSGNVGTTCVIPETLKDANCSDLVIIKNPMAIVPHFLSYYMNSAAKTYVKEGTVGIALTHFNTESVAALPIPLPPLTEQKRIVEKCDRLMSLCDTLEAKLKQGRDSSEKLMEVAAKHVLTA